jgi:hypothetical protein
MMVSKRRSNMDNTIIAYGVFGGALVGALFGLLGSGWVGLGIGAPAGAFLGWFIAAAVLERQKQTQKKK